MIERIGAVGTVLGLAIAASVPLGALAAQARRGQSVDRCQLQMVNVDRRGVRTIPTPGVENFFAGGNVHFQCAGKNVHMYSDSVANYGGKVVQFISQGTRVRYRDSTTTLDADFGTYFKDQERFEAQGNVVHRDLKSGSTITGSRVDYFRPVKGLRPELEVVAYSRPTVKYALKDSLGKQQLPYTIIGNQVKTVGSDAIYAGGSVTIKRDDLDGAADSLWLDTGKKQAGQLLGHAYLRGSKENNFTLSGRRIDIGLRLRELTRMTGRDSSRLISKDVTLDGDSIRIELTNRQAEQTRAWGKVVRPKAISADYQVKGDSITIETPAQKLSKVRAFGDGWAGFAGDTSAKEKRDWIAGEKVVVSFTDRDSAGVRKTAIQSLEAETNARSFYQLAPEKGQTKGSINYTRAKKILVTMWVTPDSNTVHTVDATDEVDGIHLQPALPKKDSTKAKGDSTKAKGADTTTIRKPKADTTVIKKPGARP